MTVADAKPGDIVEILDNGGKLASGRYYKIGDPCPIIGRVTAYQRFTGIKVQIHPTLYCRVIDDAESKTWKF